MAFSELLSPPQMSPGNYVLHHVDYVSPVELSIEPGDNGTIKYTAFGKSELYYGSHDDALSFWEYVFVSLGVDRRRYFAHGKSVSAAVDYIP